MWWLAYRNGYKDPPREFPGGPPHVTKENKAEIEKKLARASRKHKGFNPRDYP